MMSKVPDADEVVGQQVKTNEEVDLKLKAYGFGFKLILNQEGCQTLRNVFKIACDNIFSGETIVEYFVRIKLENDPLKLKEDVEEALITGFQTDMDKIHDISFESFDINLWVKVLRKLEKFKDYDKCNDPNRKKPEGTAEEPPLECCLKKIKDIRNKVAHDSLSLTVEEYEAQINELKCLIAMIWGKMGERFPYHKSDCDDNKEESVTRIDKFVGNPLGVGKQECKRSLKSLTYIKVRPHVTLPVKKIFTLPKIEDLSLPVSEGENRTKKLEKILLYRNERQGESEKNSIIFIEGVAGIGKSTLLKYLMSDWISRVKEIESLDEYDLVIPINFRASPDQALDTLCKVIRSQTPKMCGEIENDKMFEYWMPKLKLLILIDELDSMDSKWEKLLDDIIDFLEKGNATVICSSRPEKVNYFMKKIKGKLHLVHLKLGVLSAEDDMKKFVKCYLERTELICKEANVNRLLSFFSRTYPLLKSQWELPLNLSHCFVDLAFILKSVNLITVGEVFFKLIELKKEKLFKRLCQHDQTHCWRNTTLEEKLSESMLVLYEEALYGLINNTQTLKEDSLKKVRNHCEGLKIPAQELLSAFLMAEYSKSGDDVHLMWKFPNTEQQQFFAALHIYNLTCGKHKFAYVKDIICEMLKTFKEYKVHTHEYKDLVKSTSMKLFDLQSKEISDALKDPGLQNSQDFQRMLSMLISIFHNKGTAVRIYTLKEIVEHLKKAGSLDWTLIFNSIEFDEDMIRLIYQISGILEGSETRPRINCDSLIKQITWFRENCPSGQNVTSLHSNLFDIEHFDGLLTSLICQNYRLKSHCNNLFHRPDLNPTSLHYENAVQEMLSTSDKSYTGPLTANVSTVKKFDKLSVTIPNSDSVSTVKKLIHTSGENLKFLKLCINVEKVDPSTLKDIPCKGRNPQALLPDVAKQNVNKAKNIALALFSSHQEFQIHFPRCKLDSTDIRNFVESLEDQQRTVSLNLCFPEDARRSLREEQTTSSRILVKYSNFGDW